MFTGPGLPLAPLRVSTLEARKETKKSTDNAGLKSEAREQTRKQNSVDLQSRGVNGDSEACSCAEVAVAWLPSLGYVVLYILFKEHDVSTCHFWLILDIAHSQDGDGNKEAMPQTHTTRKSIQMLCLDHSVLDALLGETHTA